MILGGRLPGKAGRCRFQKQVASCDLFFYRHGPGKKLEKTFKKLLTVALSYGNI